MEYVKRNGTEILLRKPEEMQNVFGTVRNADKISACVQEMGI
jgi:hypothetical protein